MIVTDNQAFPQQAAQLYTRVNRETLQWVLARPRLHGAFLNTKMNSITLQDFPDGDGWLEQGILYGWIQGRGLEALLSHAAFFEQHDPAFAEELFGAANTLYRALASLHARHGAAYFAYDRDLQPVRKSADGGMEAQTRDKGIFTYADAFVLKGLIAGSLRFDPGATNGYLDAVATLVDAIENGRFVIDEQCPLTLETAAGQEPEFGPRMIVLGAASLLRRLGLPQATWSFGDRFIAHVLARHRDPASGLLRDAEGGDRCNVGHAIEFAGFAFEYLPADADAALVDGIAQLLAASFNAGFQEPGLCLHVSAATGDLISPYFPWWPMPETIRAVALAHDRTNDPALMAIWHKAHAAFFDNYWRGTPALAYQTRTAQGPVDYVPATPDLDPGYHTGLSLLGAIETVEARAISGSNG